MRFSTITTTLFSVALLATSVSAHGVVTAIKGANGKTGVGFGVTDPTGKKLRLFNQASRHLKGDTSVCGSQKLNGKTQTPINFDAEMKKAIDAGLPSVAADGMLSMTLFQVNADGAGPYKMEVSADGTGKKFVPMEVITQVPGTNSRSNAKNQAFPLVGKMPAGTKCTGTGGACLVRIDNSSKGLSQGFGGCMAVKVSASGGKREAAKRMAFSDIEYEVFARNVEGDENDDADTDEEVPFTA